MELNRSSLYYKKAEIDVQDLELMKLIDEQYLATPFYGRRRMTKALQNKGYNVNRKRVRRLMSLMGIEALYRKPRTSKPAPGHKIYPYLLRGVQIDHPNQAFAADITYIPLRKGFLYLVAIIDLHSRYVVSWRLSNSMDTSFCIEALEDALLHAKPEIFNTDQGSQFTSDEFTKLLGGAQVAISMDGKGRYLDNIFVERFWRSLKYEEVYLKAYVDINEARESIASWIRFYNFDRPHQALGYDTPWEIYNQDPGDSTTVASPTSVAVATVAVFEIDNLIQEEQKGLDLHAPQMVSINTITPEAEIHLSS